MNDVETPLPLMIERAASADPTRIVIQEVDGPTHTYGELHENVLSWANGFAGLGVDSGAFVATMLPTGMAGYHSWLGLSWLGAIEVPINPQFLGQTLVYPLNNSRAEVIVIASGLVDRLVPVAKDLQFLKTVVIVGDSDNALGSLDLPFRVVGAREFLAGGRPAQLVRPNYYDAHAVIYTSGTTGPSKGVLQPWVNLHGMAVGIFPDDAPGKHPGGATFTCWPSFHSSGKFGLCIGPQFDLRVVLREAFSLSSFWSDVRRYEVTHAPLLVVSGLLLSQPELPDDADTSLTKVGMYPLIPEYKEFERRFGVRVSAGYGTTEVGWAVTTTAPPNHRTNGKPSPGYEIRIANEVGESLPVNETGEILVRHQLPARLNKGYLAMPEATAEAWRDGWFHTGDAGFFDSDGYLYFVDRLKDSLRHRGHNISSFEVEAEVNAHPAVAENACVGVPSELARAGEAVKDDDVKVFVVLVPGQDLTAEELWEFLVPRLPKFMVPKHIEFVAELPKTPTGKIRKVALRAMEAGPANFTRPDERARGSAQRA